MSKWGLKNILDGNEDVPKERVYCWRAAMRDEWDTERRGGGGVGEWKVCLEGL